MALLTKWWWNLITGRGGLWRRMILEKYDIKGAHDPSKVTLRKNRLSSGWKDILKVVQGHSEVGIAFREGLKLKLGRGMDILFWEDVWVGDKALKEQYPKLFSLAITFRRPLYQWEEAYRRELLDGLRHLQVKDKEDDKLVWSFSPDGRFITNTLFRVAAANRAKKKRWEHLPLQL
ncbi:hypothetical protein QQ045_008722 [Rhodiola kirilowii]